MKIVGYTDRWSVEPGGTAKFMVSSEADRYRADVVRLIQGDTDPSRGAFRSMPVDTTVSGDYHGRPQRIRTGSYVRVPHGPRLELRRSFRIETWIHPTAPDRERQALVSKQGAFELALVAGRLELSVGDLAARLDGRVERNAWYRVTAAYDREANAIDLCAEPLDPRVPRLASSTPVEPIGAAGEGAADHDLLIAAADAHDGPCRFYDGKLDGVRILDGEDLVAAWDFSADISSRRVRDVSGNGLDGRTVNMPMRSATGHNWDGTETDWRRAPEQYGAIHFHEDDLDDAAWDADFEWTVPPDSPSGVYAVHLQAEGEDDFIPFFVRPERGRPTARVLFLAPLFSYLAYANEQQVLTVQGGWPGEPPTAAERYVADNQLLSMYDRHSDGSGVCYASLRRPMLNMRPTSTLMGNPKLPHQFSADLHLVDWLHEQGYEVDFVTDEDLHREGEELLRPYSVVLTGTHPEYVSGGMLDALDGYLNGGGKLMYLGGNGFYWVTELDPELGHTVELRRDEAQLPWLWRTEPGESHMSTTGERGGLWERRGRAPRRLVGVGSVGGGDGRPYRREAGSRDPRMAFVFEGVGDDELIGDHPSLLNSYGAASYEFDRLDYELGTPRNTLLLARASGFAGGADGFEGVMQVTEEAKGSPSWSPGEPNPVVADMTYVEYPNGGAVFSASSVGWCSCLSYNDYDNNVSTITRNVLDRFSA